MYVQGRPVEIQPLVHWNLIGSLFYHPTVFFGRISLIAPPCPQGKIWYYFKKCWFFYFSVRFENCIWDCIVVNCLSRRMSVPEERMGITDKQNYSFLFGHISIEAVKVCIRYICVQVPIKWLMLWYRVLFDSFSYSLNFSLWTRSLIIAFINPTTKPYPTPVEWIHTLTPVFS